MLKKIIFPLAFLFFLSCTEKLKDKKEIADNISSQERKSIHQQDWLEHSEKSEKKIDASNFEIIITDEKNITDKSLGKFINPKFSNDGNTLFFTTIDYSQIWNYNFVDKSISKLIDLPQSGKGFQVSKNGKYVYFRNRAKKGNRRGGVYSILKYSIENKQMDVIYKSEKRITTPVLIESSIYFLEDDKPKHFNLLKNEINLQFNIPFFFVLNNSLLRQTSKLDTILTNIKNVEFVQCIYSNDEETIISLTSNDGILILSPKGEVLNQFKNATFLDKLVNSNLVVYSVQKDDGLKISSSNLNLGFVNSDISRPIPVSNSGNKYRPVWSPLKNNIVYTTDNNIIKIISFKIEKTNK